MPSNDEVVIGLPMIQCPSCYNQLRVTLDRKVEKYSKRQRVDRGTLRMYGNGSRDTCANQPVKLSSPGDEEDRICLLPEKVYVITSCENEGCDQYNKIKILKLPRIQTPSVKVDLGDLG